jgi:hypothetical protein
LQNVFFVSALTSNRDGKNDWRRPTPTTFTQEHVVALPVEHQSLKSHLKMQPMQHKTQNSQIAF